jgi:hypothetical protein
MRNDIHREFDEHTDDPHPALRSAIRAQLEAGRSVGPGFYRFAPFAAAAAVVLLVMGTGYYALTHGSPVQPVPGASNPSPSASPSATTEPTPAPSPTPTSTLPAVTYTCTTQTGGDANSLAPAQMPNVVDVRVGSASGYDRFVIQFDGTVPQYTVTPQGSSSFVEDGSGRTFQLQGSAGLRIVVRNSSSNDVQGVQTYSGPNDFKPGSPVLKEARNMGDFERVYTWGLGLGAPNCFRAYTLTGPDRLVVDVQAP